MTRFYAGVALMVGVMLSACSSQPEQTTVVSSTPSQCVIQEIAPGQFEPLGDLSGCGMITIINANGTRRTMSQGQVATYVNQYPPSAGYHGSSHVLSDLLLYHYLFNSPRAHYYQTIYAPHYRTYTSYRTTHPVHTYYRPNRTWRNTSTGVTTSVRNGVVRTTAPVTAKRSWYTVNTSTTSTRVKTGTSGLGSSSSSGRSWFGGSSRSYSSGSRSFSSGSRSFGGSRSFSRGR